MTDRILERIERQAGVPGLLELLSRKLSHSDLTSLLMQVCASRAASLSPAQLLARYRADARCAPSPTDAVRLQRLSLLAIDCLPASTQAVELSPVAPLGTCSAMSTVPQNNVLSSVRALEVMADATNALALECAARRSAAGARSEPIRLACSERVLRMQFKAAPGLMPHFRLFAMVTAGRDRGSLDFEAEALTEHLATQLGLLSRLGELGLAARGARLTLSDFRGDLSGFLAERVQAPLAAQFRDVAIALDPERTRARGYYRSVAFDLSVQGPDGEPWNVADGGFTDWTQQLLSDRKERLLISGLGLERLLAAASARSE